MANEDDVSESFASSPTHSATDLDKGSDGSKNLDAPKIKYGVRSSSETVAFRDVTGYERQLTDIKSVVYAGLRFPIEYECAGYQKELLRARGPEDSVLFVCNTCFKYTMDPAELCAHDRCCHLADEAMGSLVHSIEEGRYQIYEVDGADEKYRGFLQRMCLFGKLFIHNKYIWYEFDNFLFYVLVENCGTGPNGKQIFRYAGFFSKEKVSYDDNNLACIIIFPPFRRRGLGVVLIDFSYLIAHKLGKTGGPEKPISELGKLGYLSYWSKTLARTLSMHVGKRDMSKASTRSRITKRKNLVSESARSSANKSLGRTSLEEMSKITGITPDDILDTLLFMGVLDFNDGRPVISQARLRKWIEKRNI